MRSQPKRYTARFLILKSINLAQQAVPSMSEPDNISFLHGSDGDSPARSPRPAASAPASEGTVRKIDHAVFAAAAAVVIVIFAVGLSSAPSSPSALPPLTACSNRPAGTNGSLPDMRSYFDALSRHTAAASLPLQKNMYISPLILLPELLRRRARGVAQPLGQLTSLQDLDACRRLRTRRCDTGTRDKSRSSR